MNLEFLKTLIDIDSRSHNIEGINKVQKFLADTLISLGFEVDVMKENQDTARELLFAQRKGITDRAITLVCHADTVFASDSEFQFKIDFKQGRVYGPGIGDNKGGIALLVGALKDYIESRGTHFYTINVICSPSEEIGSIGYHQFFKKIGEESDFVFGFEPALSNGDIIAERSGNRWYNVNIKGKAGHAGRWNDPTINSAHLLSKFIANISELSSYELKRRVNIAHIEAGISKHNVICENAHAKIDTRFKDFESRDLIHQEIIKNLEDTKTKIIDTDVESEYSFEIVDDCPPMERNNNSKPIINLILEKIKMFEGRKVYASYSGGAADINYFQRPGLISVDGLGPVTAKMHSKEEYIEIDSFYSRRHVFVELLISLNELNIKAFQNGVELNGNDYP